MASTATWARSTSSSACGRARRDSWPTLALAIRRRPRPALHPQRRGAERPLRKWWSEASAEYFSNVVYDDVNYEFRFAGEFDDQSPVRPLPRMGYENFVFFQYLANRIGDRELIEFLRTMPTSGGEPEQMTALATWPD